MRARKKRHSTISVRLSRDEERLVRRIARRRQSTVSEVVRHAIRQLAESEAQKPMPPYEEIADLIGSVSDLPSNLSDGW